MPRLLALGHVSRDRRPGGDVLGGSVTYGTLTARKLGWEAAILTAAGPDFEPGRELPGVPAFVRRSSATTRFVNEYDADGTRHQIVTARAEDVDLEPLPAFWRDPDALLLGPLVGARPPSTKIQQMLFPAGPIRSFTTNGSMNKSPRF